MALHQAPKKRTGDKIAGATGNGFFRTCERDIFSRFLSETPKTVKHRPLRQTATPVPNHTFFLFIFISFSLIASGLADRRSNPPQVSPLFSW
jgi:hypothetical protein